ncbi:MAG: carboxypeptidase-like regulatory domain-containing protein [Bernardetiaceae bacterium]|nr:carboxypeptidase-like regulatory domain-containing protein [Bernardetiaceae bacterium]
MKQKTYWGIFLFLILGIYNESLAQRAVVLGRVVQANKTPIAFATIGIEGKTIGTSTDEQGNYRLSVPANEDFTLEVRYVGYKRKQYELRLTENQLFVLDITLEVSEQETGNIVIEEKKDLRDRKEGMQRISMETLKRIPTGFDDFSQQLMTIGLGIVSNSELSSAYSVRGGNFEENLIYVNGMEIYRPFLVRAGEQEGLSFVNPEMVESVSFSAGGWQPKYGDKLASVLDVTYKKPKSFAASATAGLLGGNVNVEGSNKKQTARYVASVRYKDARYLFNTLETNGEFLPRFLDAQGYFYFDLNKDKRNRRGDSIRVTSLDFIFSLAENRYNVIPSNRETTFGTFDQQMRLSVNYRGQEIMQYETAQAGLRLQRQFSEKFNSYIMLSAVGTGEREFFDVEGSYRLCDVDTDISSDNFNRCALTRGVASEYRHARNTLKASILSLQNRSTYRHSDKLTTDFGFTYRYENINDQLYEYNFTDSAGYAERTYFLDANLGLQSSRITAYAQQTLLLSDTQDSSAAVHYQSLTYGLRMQYWSVNGELMWSPRVQYSIRPNWQRDITWHAATGIYRQMPFYRELRNFEGELNRDIRAQSSAHFTLGMDWNFEQWERPFKFLAEAYYKPMWDVIPYDIDNMRLRYYAENAAIAYAVGLDMRVSGEFIPNTESWFSLSFMSVRENVDFDNNDFIRRPSDQRITATIFFEDHIPNNPTIRMYLRTLIGSGLPFGPPQSIDFRSALSAPPYRRVDLGFSKSILFKSSERRYIESLWLGVEVMNVLGVENVISYTWVSDFINDFRFAVPNGLSQRFFNLKILARFR